MIETLEKNLKNLAIKRQKVMKKKKKIGAQKKFWGVLQLGSSYGRATAVLLLV